MKYLSLLFIIPFLNIAFAQSIEVDYPKKVNLNEEFEFKIKLIGFEEDIYNVKIDIKNNETRIARIFNNGEWKSTYYYVKNISFKNNEKIFLMNITKKAERGDIIITIKNSKENRTIFNGYEISINTEKSPTKKIKEDIRPTEKKDLNAPIKTNENTFTSTNKSVKKEKILLNKIDLVEEPENNFKWEIRKPLSGFIIFCILLTLLSLFKKRRIYRNEFDA